MSLLFFGNGSEPGKRRALSHNRHCNKWAAALHHELLENRYLLNGISLAPSEAAPQLVGEPIVWTATVNDGPTAGLVYQFREGAPNGPVQVVRDFSLDNHFTWAPLQEGDYRIMVTVKQGFSATDVESAVVQDEVDSRVSGAEAVITPMANPLVALYSAPPLPIGAADGSCDELMHVEFSVASAQPSWESTNALRTKRGESTNFIVAGMLPNTTYEMRDVLEDGTASSPLLFTTGNLPSTLSFPTFTEQQPPAVGSDLDQDMIFHGLSQSASNVPNPLATDLQGRVTWYYDVSHSGLTRTYPGQNLVPGGTVLLLGVDQYAASPATLDDLREIDLAGNLVRETNVEAVNAQLTALGHNPVFSFTHDVKRLPNGQTAVVGSTERTVDVNGTATNTVGMTIVVLDSDFHVTWVWDAFDHLDVNRGPTLGDTLKAGDADQVASSTPVLPAVDWLHLNAVSWSPADGNLVLSLRAQDWVIKVDYESGSGDGHVIWRLGQGGDFTVNSTDPNPWFSHQHNAHFADDHTLILFDNGNARRAADPHADSRGQAWTLDEATMTATLVVNADMGNYSNAFGAAQRLSNGNFSFMSGRTGQAPNLSGQSIEVSPDGARVYDLQANRPEFRSFRVRTLYEGVDDALSGPSQTTASEPESSKDDNAAIREPSLLAEAVIDAVYDITTLDSAELQPGEPHTGGEITSAGFLSSEPWTWLPTPKVMAPAGVERLDQFFAIGIDEQTDL